MTTRRPQARQTPSPTSKSKRKTLRTNWISRRPSAPPLPLAQPLPAVTPRRPRRSAHTRPLIRCSTSEDPLGSSSDRRRHAKRRSPHFQVVEAATARGRTTAIAAASSDVCRPQGPRTSPPPGAPSAAEPIGPVATTRRASHRRHASHASSTAADAASLASSVDSSATQAELIPADARPSEPLPHIRHAARCRSPAHHASGAVGSEVPFATAVRRARVSEPLSVRRSASLRATACEEAELHLNPAEMGPISVRI